MLLPVLGCIKRRPYAQTISGGWRLKEVQPPLIVCVHAQSPEEILAEKTIPEDQLELCRELGAALGAGLSMGIF